MSQDAPRPPQATVRQLHRRALRSNAGPHRPRRGAADRPATLIDSRRPGPQTRRRARQLPLRNLPKKTAEAQSAPPRHAHGALLRAGADGGHAARSRLQGSAGDGAEARARRGAGQGVTRSSDRNFLFSHVNGRGTAPRLALRLAFGAAVSSSPGAARSGRHGSGPVGVGTARGSRKRPPEAACACPRIPAKYARRTRPCPSRQGAPDRRSPRP